MSAPPEDLIGAIFGELRVLALQGEVDGHRYWICRCGCGRECVRRTETLRERAREQKRQMCLRCARKRGTDAIVRAQQHKAFAGQYRDVGSLWTFNQTERLTNQIRDDFAEAFGPMVEHYGGPRTIESGETRAPKPRQYECAKADSGEFTLDQIGKELGVTRQRAQQIECIALGKAARALHRLDPELFSKRLPEDFRVVDADGQGMSKRRGRKRRS